MPAACCVSLAEDVTWQRLYTARLGQRWEREPSIRRETNESRSPIAFGGSGEGSGTVCYQRRVVPDPFLEEDESPFIGLLQVEAA
jgi:hypothetical protein